MAESYARIGLQINLDKTKIMFNEPVIPEPEPNVLNGESFEVVQEYLGWLVQLGRNNFEMEEPMLST